jgi:glucose/arabinose dehydrogenase
MASMTSTSIFLSLAALCVSCSSEITAPLAAQPDPKAPKFIQATVDSQYAGQLNDAPPPEHIPPGPRGVPDFYVRPGYRVDVVSDRLPETHFLLIAPDGTLLMSRPGIGDIVRFKLDADGKYQDAGTFVKGVHTLHGMYWHDGWLWYTSSGTVNRARCTNGTGVANEIESIVPQGMMPDGGHWWRPILVDEEGFYTSIGDAGNVTDQMESERQKIWRYDLKGQNKKLFAAGIRNTEKLLFRPGTKEIWGFDHGSDWYGREFGDHEGDQPITEEVPPEKLNHYVQGGFYGHPYFVGGRYPRPEYFKKPDLIAWANKVIMPAMTFPAHWAPDGWCFYQGPQIPDAKGDAFICFHGSWNRRYKEGYRVERVVFDKITGEPVGHYAIVVCLTPDGRQLARPDDVIEAPDGSLLFTDDAGNKIYRIRYVGGHNN